MPHSRTGKIARLPHKIREELNRRLQDGEETKSLAKWLNSLPEVQSVLARHFAARPINLVNLSEWKNGGYRDWLLHQDANEFVQHLEDSFTLVAKTSDNTVGQMFAHWLVLHYGIAAKALVLNESDPSLKWSRLHQLCLDVARLRRVELAADRVQLEFARFDDQQAKDHLEEMDKMKKQLRASELFLEVARQHFPDLPCFASNPASPAETAAPDSPPAAQGDRPPKPDKKPPSIKAI